MSRNLILVLFAAFTLIVLPEYSSASPREVRRARVLEKQSVRAQRKALRAFLRLSSDDKVRAINGRINRSDDSDSDGVPDGYEDSSGRCNSDSDGDGLYDGDEYQNGTDPKDDDSDGDGNSDGSEVEKKGFITALGESTVVVAGTTFILDSNTVYLDDDKNSVTKDAFEVGGCAEVEGHTRGDDIVADKVKSDNDCVE